MQVGSSETAVIMDLSLCASLGFDIPEILFFVSLQAPIPFSDMICNNSNATIQQPLSCFQLQSNYNNQTLHKLIFHMMITAIVEIGG